MTTHVEVHVASQSSTPSTMSRIRSLRWLVPVGRILFAAIFVMASFGHFSAPQIAYGAAHGVPMAGLVVPLAGLLALMGGLSVMLGFKARYGAALIVLFLLPVTLVMHRFWGLPDPQEAMMQQAMFMKNLSMLGAALVLTYFGAGPISLDNRRARRTA
jgi:putative oxidoreductase